MKKIILAVFVLGNLFYSATAIAQIPYLVKDINDARDSYPQNERIERYTNDNQPFAVLKSRAYFAVLINDGWQLWRSDGTTAGTQLVKIISTGGSKVPLYEITACGDFIFFIADDGVHGPGLWKSDGTAAGTILLRYDALANSQANNLSLTAIKNTLFYISNDHINGPQLWKSDGTIAGTAMVKNIPNGNGYNVTNFSVIDSTIYFSFSSNDSTYGGLWRTDGTDTGTHKIQTYTNQGNNALTPAGHQLFYVNNELWVSDGTANNAHVVRDINPSLPPNIGHLVALKDILYFNADDGVNGNELWRSDGTEAGTYMVKDINPMAGQQSNPSCLTVVDSLLFFLANSGSGNYELWKTNGTLTEKVRSFGNEPLASGKNLANINGKLYLSAYTTAHGFEVWSSDGSTTGTHELKDIFPGVYSSSPYAITNLKDKCLFSATDESHGTELWITDGFAAGTTLIKDINSSGATSSSSSVVASLTNFKNKLFFGASTNKYGFELWSTDGTTSGTSLADDIQPGGLSGLVALVTPFVTTDNSVYFIGNTLKNGQELWKSDGTASGTTLVKDITVGPADTRYNFSTYYDAYNTFAGVKNTLYFTADSLIPYQYGGVQSSKPALWKTSGTPGTTSIVKVFPGTGFYGIYNLTPADNSLYFSVKGDIWKTDGTEAGTIKTIAKINYTGFFDEYRFRFLNGFLYYVSTDNELWKTDGTNVEQVKDINPGVNGSNPSSLVISKNKIFFTANDGISGKEIWVTNGTATGTLMVKDLSTGSNSSNPFSLIDVNGLVYFFTAETPSSTKLWVTDGTTAGTTLVKEIEPGNAVKISSVIKAGNKICFIVSNNAIGTVKIWQSDGSPAGTKQLNTKDIVIPADYFSDLLAVLNDVVYFPAYSPATGTELWSYNLSSPLPVLLSNFSVELHNADGLLKWKTVAEQNADYFAIQRSTDGISFDSIGRVTAAGNSSTMRSYKYTDIGVTKLGAGKVYYRLQQVDKDGRQTVSNTLMLNIYTDVNVVMSPNPVTNSFAIKLSSLHAQVLGIQVTDVRGAVMLQDKKSISPGENTISYNASAWANGVYMVNIFSGGSKVKSIQIVKQ